MYSEKELEKKIRTADDIEAFKRAMEQKYLERTALDKNWSKHKQTCAKNRKKRKRRKR